MPTLSKRRRLLASIAQGRPPKIPKPTPIQVEESESVDIYPGLDSESDEDDVSSDSEDDDVVVSLEDKKVLYVTIKVA